MEQSLLLSVKNISKYFPGVHALSDVSLDFYQGKVHILLGENGAGKSTLAKIIAGVYKRDCGQIILHDKPVYFSTTKQAIDAGVSMIHQELNLLPDLTVADNIFIGREIINPRTRLLDKKMTFKKAGDLLRSISIDINPQHIIRNLSTGEKQMVEIARAVSLNSSLVIMDEPTSSLSESEVKSLFDIIEKLKKEKVGIIYVTHRLREIFEIGDLVTIMRDGHVICTSPVKDICEKKMVSLMVGREIKNYFNKETHESNSTVMEVKHLSILPKLKSVSFSLRQGEILGIAGLIGSGRTEILRAIFGIDKIDGGEIIISGSREKKYSPKSSIKKSIGLVPEERRTQGILLNKSVRENITLPIVHKLSKFNFIQSKIEKEISKEYLKILGIKAPSIESLVENLSGGNQQKIVLSKWLAANSKILLLDEPTRGIDVGAKSEIYELMNEFTRNGGSIIMVSSELPEILGVSDRILVMRDGEMVGVLDRSEATEEIIMRLASTSETIL